jgi:hypothetical protein
LALVKVELQVPVEQDNTGAYVKAACAKLAVDDAELVKILRKSLNITNKEQFYFDLEIVVSVSDSIAAEKGLPVYIEDINHVINTQNQSLNAHKPIIVGFGPAGMFAALEFMERGIKPLVFERGKKIEERDADIDIFVRQRLLNPESNIQFGEGGAGSYSDGKLFSRARNTPHNAKVLDTLIKFGAPAEIAYIEKPHVGTDVLKQVVKNIRGYILDTGGEIRYSSKVTDITVENGTAAGVVVNGSEEHRADSIFIAVGHSARDTFTMLHNKGIPITQKPIAIGVRIEHPAEHINLMRYGGKYSVSKAVGAATYSFNHIARNSNRLVSTFCVCPGGEIVNAASENGLLVTNGMSYSARASAFTNSAVIVWCKAEDYGSADPLAGIEFQKIIERKAYMAGGGNWRAPAQNLYDFMISMPSREIHKNSFKLGVTPAYLSEILPGFVSAALFEAFNEWAIDYPLFISDKAVLIGAETRTSCPIKFERNNRYESIGIKNLYPIGEGSGHTGGITSSAADAIKAVESCLNSESN